MMNKKKDNAGMGANIKKIMKLFLSDPENTLLLTKTHKKRHSWVRSNDVIIE